MNTEPSDVTPDQVSEFSENAPGLPGPAADLLPRLRQEMDAHPLWHCRLLRACNAGHLTLEDWRYVFSQYHWYCNNFTRFIAAAMVTCTNDYYRSRLSQNLWEEGGMLKPEERHTEIFREFLRRGLGVEPTAIRYEAFTEHFVQQVLQHCIATAPAYASAFLALGTEATVPRLYGFFHQGLRQVGVSEPDLRFFAIHMACDDEHAATLQELMVSYAAEPDWERHVREGMWRALDLRLQFFEQLYDGLSHERVAGVVRGIQARQPLGPVQPSPDEVLFSRESRGAPLYANLVERLNVEFAVERVPFGAQVLDTRLVHIPPGRCNERHKHAHESVFLILQGHGQVLVGESHVPARVGDLVFVPRWVLHQTENQGTEEMVVLAITDSRLTERAFVGDYHRTARLKRATPETA